MDEEQREVLDCIHVVWKAFPKLTLAELFTKAFHEPYQQDYARIWEWMTDKEVCNILLDLVKPEGDKS
jgi:hypothetical protein